MKVDAGKWMRRVKGDDSAVTQDEAGLRRAGRELYKV
jgi:hypothetical protein